MAHVVFIIGKLVSLRHAVVAASTHLQAAGHDVTIASMDDIGTAIAEHNLPYLQLDKRGSYSDAGQFIRKWLRIEERRAAELAAWDMPAKIEAISTLEPDLLVIETELPELVIGLSQLGIPIATIAYFASIYKHPSVPPLHTDIIAGRKWRGSRVGIEWRWLRYRLQRGRREIRHFLRHAALYRVGMLHYYARQVGFDENKMSVFQWLIPTTFSGLPLLYPTAIEFDFPHTPQPNVYHLGPLMTTQVASPQDNDDTRLSDLLDAHQAHDTGQKLLYCAFGSAFAGNDLAFFQRVIAAVAQRPDWTLILSLGRRLPLDDLGPLPAHIHAFEWVPQTAVLARVDAAIVHAGLATCMECIHAGVPMLSYPFSVNDQAGNAARIAYHHLGIVGDRTTDTPETIQQHIEHLLSDEQFQQAVDKMRGTIAHYTPEHVVTIFEGLFAKQPSE